jgi:hypothetical protein
MALPIKGGIWENIEYTPKELKVQEINSAIFG